MNDDTPCQLLSDPLSLWMELAHKTTETLLASAQVISHRADRFVGAGPAPSPRDLHEFNLMGQEKMEAVFESSQAMSIEALQTNFELWNGFIGQLQAGTAAFLALAGSRDLPESMRRQAALIDTLLQEAAVAAADFGCAPARLAHSGLRPIHARATANAVRLSRYPAVRPGSSQR